MAQPTGVFIDITGWGLAKEQRGPFAVFVIRIRLGKYAWTVFRRYSEFARLNAQLQEQIYGAAPCPPRGPGGVDHATLANLRLVLLEWIRRLANDERVCRSASFHDFLRANANRPPAGMGKPVTVQASRPPGAHPAGGGAGGAPGGPRPSGPHGSGGPGHPGGHGGPAGGAPPSHSARGGAGPGPGPGHYSAGGAGGPGARASGPSSGAAPMDGRGASGGPPGGRPSGGGSPAKKYGAGGAIGLRDFMLLKVVGKGSFGKVMQVRKRSNNRIYAMKVLDKSYVVARNQVAHTQTERSVLGQVRHPFVVGLKYAFYTEDKLYFVLDYCAGGELFFHLSQVGRFEEPRACYYSAQIVLALEHLHSKGIIYRDLKPENVLLDHHGNIRITDFGLSKENVHETAEGAHSFCGTPEYLAPEILDRSGHGRGVDWWSLGALLYEMLTGLPPFYCKDRSVLFKQIRTGTLEFPPYLSNEAKDILCRLLCRDPRRRLGCGPRDAEDIKAHPFFRRINWPAMLACKVPPPWRPRVTHSLDTSQFDSEFTDMPVSADDAPGAGKAPLSSSMKYKADQAFRGFTFTGDHALAGRGGPGAGSGGPPGRGGGPAPGGAGGSGGPPTVGSYASKAFGGGAKEVATGGPGPGPSGAPAHHPSAIAGAGPVGFGGPRPGPGPSTAGMPRPMGPQAGSGGAGPGPGMGGMGTGTGMGRGSGGGAPMMGGHGPGVGMPAGHAMGGPAMGGMSGGGPGGGGRMVAMGSAGSSGQVEMD